MSITRPGGSGSTDRITVPCGKCSHCKTRRREDWSVRLYEEYKDHTHAIFLTLTYNDKNIIYADYLPTLHKPDLQNFLKRLRKSLTKKIRFYALGEYGGKTARPHYHLLLFNVSENDYEKIVRAWSIFNKNTSIFEPIGNIHIGDVNIKSIKYVTKYHVNRNEHPPNVEPEFTTMSNRPAIGSGYVEKMRRYHRRSIDNSYYSMYNKKLHLPRFYRDKLYTKAEKEMMSLVFQSKDYTDKDRKNYELKNPKGNYFKYLLDKIQNTEKQFINKKRENETI